MLAFEGELDLKEDQEERSRTKEKVNNFQEEDDARTFGWIPYGNVYNVKFFNLHQGTLDELCHLKKIKRQ